MFIKKIGIFTAQPGKTFTQNTELNQLLEYIAKPNCSPDERSVIACPSWAEENLRCILRNMQIKQDDVEFIVPKERPVILVISQFMQRIFAKKEKIIKTGTTNIGKLSSSLVRHSILRIFSSRNWLSFIFSISFFLIFSPLLIFFFLQKILVKIMDRFSFSPQLGRLFSRVKIKEENLYNLLINHETNKIVDLINNRHDVDLWIIPVTAVIDLKRLQKTAIIYVSGDAFFSSPVEYALNALVPTKILQHRMAYFVDAKFFITSNNKLREELITKYSCPKDNVAELSPPVIALRDTVSVSGFPNNDLASLGFCQSLVKQGIIKNYNPGGVFHLGSTLNYLFCPIHNLNGSHNMHNLLQAYKAFLQEERPFIKLIIYGRKEDNTTFYHLIEKYSLQQQVIWLEQINEQELAAFYKLASFIINPCLEFYPVKTSFAQALSLTTPILMTRTIETMGLFAQQQELLSILFDPYDWQDMAVKMKLALMNRATILDAQQIVYNSLPALTIDNKRRELHEVLEKFMGIEQTKAFRQERHENQNAPVASLSSEAIVAEAM